MFPEFGLEGKDRSLRLRMHRWPSNMLDASPLPPELFSILRPASDQRQAQRQQLTSLKNASLRRCASYYGAGLARLLS